ncbi:2-polyprenyl-3-methyl-5-hydroxy-6-metoxy-1,4-benzoquinol methylase [Pseudarthrobacter sp. PvP004]|uniref:class I SAM-dependent methyltransferase n=1 Tax=Pseudarthrobacter sp. PvP004 TaxID=2817850 RepID=UPI001AE9404E|nr:class I SAM-dependent methyltransferase [Pseudarthrobacter sp. PvP004]MBP2266572.1 2-polyprenyl-3-methyl-5-hydroxy-6-metoxy-1,4-benzoquinol methylase [Pseudarthrobacter sp. PvP004]
MNNIQTEQHQSPTPTRDSVEQAAGRMIGILNDSSIALLIGVGHQTGLFETLAALPAAGSDLIADAAGLNERYVREWLGGMTSAGFVDYQPDRGTYSLRPEFVPVVTGPGTENLARTLQYVPLMGEVAPKVAQAFRTGGGTSYDDYPRFHHIMASESAAVNDASLVETILPLTGCVDALRRGISVADIGCGEGHAMNLLAATFPASTFTGYDFSGEALATASDEASAAGLSNVRFELQDVSRLETEEPFDLVTAFDAIHDQARPAEVLKNIRAALKPEGTFLMVDINASSRLEDNVELPWAAFLYTISTFHCMAVSLGQGGDGLGTVWGKQRATDMLLDAGFRAVEVKELEEDPFNAYYVARP